MPMDAFETALEQAKLAAMKELAYGASHEINNPLANIAAQAQALLRFETDLERRRALAAIHTQAMR
ncbi:MAG: sensor histidine kinase, partial [Pirellulales bacterium]|nr:sensor histidine kinase [Pirellulales bacterium]